MDEWMNDRQEAMPTVPGWYLVELEGVVNQPESGFAVDYCRAASDSDGGGMEWAGYYPRNVVAWHSLPERMGGSQ